MLPLHWNRPIELPDERCADDELRENAIEVLADKVYIAMRNEVVLDRYILRNACVTDIIDLTGYGSEDVCRCETPFCFHRGKVSMTKGKLCSDLCAAVNYLKKRVFKKDCDKIVFIDRSYFKLYSLAVCFRYLKTYLFSDMEAEVALRQACQEKSIRFTKAVRDLEKSIVTLPRAPPLLLCSSETGGVDDGENNVDLLTLLSTEDNDDDDQSTE